MSLQEIEETLNYMAGAVTLHKSKKKAKIGITLNSTEFDSIEKAKKFIAHYDSNYSHSGQSFADKIVNIKLEAKCTDADEDSYRDRGYRNMEVDIRENQVRTMVYGDNNTDVSWVHGQAELFDAHMRQYALPVAAKAVKVVGLSSAGLISVGGLVAGLLISPFFLPVIVVGGAIAFASHKTTQGKIISKVSFLPAPERNADVLVNVAR
jgi:hypothetical protein